MIMVTTGILDKIVQTKQQEVEERKALYPVKLLERSLYYETTPVSLAGYLQRSSGPAFIAEFKRKSPSKGMINAFADSARVTLEYMQAGASALSVLTDKTYFGGSSQDLEMARKVNYCPILRKDFIIDEYQIIEAKSIGADAILLIAAILDKDEVKRFAELAIALGMEVLLEIHDVMETDRIIPDVIVGVNNRDLNDFRVDLGVSEKLAGSLGEDILKVSESGIHTSEDVLRLHEFGYKGFLIGERFMSTPQPGKACRDFIQAVRGAYTSQIG